MDALTLQLAQMEIRLANPADISNIADLLSRTFYQGQGWRSLFNPILKMGLCYELATRLQLPSPDKYQCLIVEVQDPRNPKLKLLVGTVEISLRSLGITAMMTAQKAYISNLAVKQDYRQRGIALMLLQRCEDIAKRWDHHTLFLHVRSENTVALSLYEKLGYHTSVDRSPIEMQRRLLTKRI